MPGKFSFDASGNYRIKVRGQIQPDWFERFGSLHVTAHPKVDYIISVLEGTVSDQTELAGILNTLYELHLSLISVQHLDDVS